MKNYYCTFGCGQVHQNGYVKISANTENEAREEMFRRFGNKWCTSYTEKEFLPQIEKYNLREVK